MTQRLNSALARQLVVDAAMRTELFAFLQAAFPIVSAGTDLLLNWHLEAIPAALMVPRCFAGET